MWAEVPSALDKELRDAVLKNSIHTRCVPSLNAFAVCKRNDTCQKYFLTQFVNEMCCIKHTEYATNEEHPPAVNGKEVNSQLKSFV